MIRFVNKLILKLRTVRCKILKGSENGEFESVVYRTVSFSAPNMIASSNNIAVKELIKVILKNKQTKISYLMGKFLNGKVTLFFST